MAPFRPSGRSNRSGRSQADHDIFEGLPIKQWRHSETTVGLPTVVGEPKVGDNAWPELPMPRDSHLLADWTQALLREARRPRLAKRKDPTEDEKGEDDEDTEKEMQTGFLAKKWAQVPAHLEEPEREYLAKRRKGLPSVHATLALQAAVNIPATSATRKAKVLKTDAQGNTTVYEVIVPEGQAVEGEVQQDTEMTNVEPEKAIPGTVIDGVGIANAEGVFVANDLLQPQAPPRRRNMPPKRVKKGGPGRGKKKVMFTAEGQASTLTPGGTSVPLKSASGEGGAGEPMDIDSVRKGGENDENGENGENGDDGEEGEDDDDDDDDHEEGELSDGEIGQEDTPSNQKDSTLPSKFNEPSGPPEINPKQLETEESKLPAPLESAKESAEAKDEEMQDAPQLDETLPKEEDTASPVKEEIAAPVENSQEVEQIPAATPQVVEEPVPQAEPDTSQLKLEETLAQEANEDIEPLAAPVEENEHGAAEKLTVETETEQTVPEETKATELAEIEEQVPAEAEPEPQAELESEPQVEVEQEPQVKVEQEPQAEVEQEPQAEVEQEPPVVIEQEPSVEIEQEPSVEIEQASPSKIEETSSEKIEEAPPEKSPEAAAEGQNDSNDALSGLERALESQDDSMT